MKNKRERMVSVVVLVGMLWLAMASVSGAGLFGKDETVGARFEKNLKGIAAACTKRKLAPNEVCGEVAKLKPADPLATEEGRLAHSIKIPNPVPEDSGYKPGMTSQEYFDHLCKTEAGEFIYKTVENVEGIYMMRPRQEATDWELEHLYALEDPYGQVLGVGRLAQDSYVQPAMGKYQFLEMPVGPTLQGDRRSARYKRYFRDEYAHAGRQYQTAIKGQFVRVPYSVAEAEVPARNSRYGYAWRGIKRPHDRELGIVGGELIVLDLQTNEVLAVRRGYIRSGWMKNLTGIWWLTGRVCPNLGGKREHLFIKEILKPVTESVAGEEK